MWGSYRDSLRPTFASELTVHAEPGNRARRGTNDRSAVAGETHYSVPSFGLRKFSRDRSRKRDTTASAGAVRTDGRRDRGWAAATAVASGVVWRPGWSASGLVAPRSAGVGSIEECAQCS